MIVTQVGRQSTQQAHAGQHGQDNAPNPERREDAGDHTRPKEQRQGPHDTIAQATSVLGARELVKERGEAEEIKEKKQKMELPHVG